MERSLDTLLWAEEIAQRPRTLLIVQRTQVQFQRPISGGSQLPVAPVPNPKMPDASELHGHLYSGAHSHPDTAISTVSLKNKRYIATFFFKKNLVNTCNPSNWKTEAGGLWIET